MTIPVSSWGRLDHDLHTVVALTDRRHVARLMRAHRPGLAHGMGRSYGDVCLNPGGVLWNTRGLDRFISFDPANGRLMNFWINEHDVSNPAGCRPLLIMDVFEHAYMLDYGLKRVVYIDAFFSNIDWPAVDARLL